MKKILVLFALIVSTSATGILSSANSTDYKAVKGGVPEAVMVGFDQTTSDVINNWYPGNNGYDASNVSWKHQQGDWVCTGDVILSGDTRGINVVEAHYKNTGEFISYNYNVIQ